MKPEDIKVGQLWDFPRVGEPGEIIYIHESVAWVQMGNKDHASYSLEYILEFCVLRSKPTPVAPTKTILEEAAAIVDGDRERDYAHPSVNFERIRLLWIAYFKGKYGVDLPLTQEDIPYLMIELKVARGMARRKRDTPMDIAGYARTIEKLWEKDDEDQTDHL